MTRAFKESPRSRPRAVARPAKKRAARSTPERTVAVSVDEDEAVPMKKAEAEDQARVSIDPSGDPSGEAPIVPAAAARSRVRASAGDEPANLLSRYFRDLTRLPPLRPFEEFERARHLEALEIARWLRILGEPRLLPRVLPICERALVPLAIPVAELGALSAALSALQASPSPDARQGFVDAAERAACRLRALDLDKEIVSAAMDALRLLGDERTSENATAAGNGAVLSRYLREINAIDRQARQAKNEFVKANLRLVVSVARRYTHGPMPLSDLIQEGNLGLVKAVDRFDHRRGYRFSTYASWWIRHAISRALANTGRPVRLPVHLIDAYHRIARSRHQLEGQLGRAPTSDELRDATGIPRAKMEQMERFLVHQSHSLDEPVGGDEGEGRKFLDLLRDPEGDERTTADDMIDRTMISEVHTLLTQLKPIESDILLRRFGLDGNREMTLHEIGEKYHLSRERIRQLEGRALRKMRDALERRDLL